MLAGQIKPRPTRYKELGYWQAGPGLWRILDLTDGAPSEVGPFYRSKVELLTDLARYARQFGCAE